MSQRTKHHRLSAIALSLMASLLVFCTASAGFSASARLTWAAPSENEDGSPVSSLAGYRIHYGRFSGSYEHVSDVGPVVVAQVAGLEEGSTYFFVVTAYNALGAESLLSSEAVYTVPDTTPPVLQIQDTIALVADANGNGLVPDLTTGSAITDNCSPRNCISVQQIPSAGTVLSGPSASTVTVTATDEAGNHAAVSVSLCIEDCTPPVFTVPSSRVVAANESNEGLMPDLLAESAACDNCSSAACIALQQEPAAGTALPLGTTVAVLTATDEAGNETVRTTHVQVMLASSIARRPTLEWDAVPGATWYYLWITRDGSTFYRKWLDDGSTSWTPDFDMQGGEYTWSVLPYGTSIGYGSWSESLTFVIPLMVPSATTLIAPAGVVDAARPEFSWETVEHASVYLIWLSRDGNTYLKQWVENGTSFTPPADLAFGNYTWWVRTWGPDGYGPYSAMSSFTYGVAKPVAPSGTITYTARPTFSWSGPASAVSYDIRLKKDGADYVEVQLDNQTSWTPQTSLPTGAYSWMVRSWSAGGQYTWSPGLSFSIP